MSRKLSSSSFQGMLLGWTLRRPISPVHGVLEAGRCHSQVLRPGGRRSRAWVKSDRGSREGMNVSGIMGFCNPYQYSSLPSLPRLQVVLDRLKASFGPDRDLREDSRLPLHT